MAARFMAHDKALAQLLRAYNYLKKQPELVGAILVRFFYYPFEDALLTLLFCRRHSKYLCLLRGSMLALQML